MRQPPRRPSRPKNETEPQNKEVQHHRPKKPANFPTAPTPIVYSSDVQTVAEITAPTAPTSETPVFDVNERLEERKAETKRVRKRMIVRIILTILTLIAAIAFIFFNPLWNLQAAKIRVNGIPDDSVITADDVTNIAARRVGTPITRISMKSLEKTIEKELPAIAHADSKRAFLHGLKINISMREPIACVERAAQCEGIDTGGNYFPVTPDQIAHLPHVTLDSGAQENESLEKTVNSAIHVLRGLDENVRGATQKISISKSGRISLHLNNGKQVIWGVDEKNDVKAKALQALIDQPGSVVDVSEPTAVIMY